MLRKREPAGCPLGSLVDLVSSAAKMPISPLLVGRGYCLFTHKGPVVSSAPMCRAGLCRRRAMRFSVP